MFDNIIEQLNEEISIDEAWDDINRRNNMSISEEVDELLDEAFSENNRVEPKGFFTNESFEELTEPNSFHKFGDKEEMEIERKNLRESLVFNSNKEIRQVNMDDLLDESFEENSFIHNFSLNEEEEYEDNYKSLGESIIFDMITLNESKKEYEYKFDKELATVNVKKILEKKNNKMRKKGYVPLTSSNKTLINLVKELKTKYSDVFSKIAIMKINGVVVLVYFDKVGNCFQNAGVEYYNKEKDKIREFSVIVSKRTLKEDSIIEFID